MTSFSERKFWPMPGCFSDGRKKRDSIEIMRVRETVEIFHVSGVATLVWKRFNGKTTMGQVIAEIVKKYDATKSQAEKDVKDFVDRLLYLELICEATPSSKASKPYSSVTKRLQSRQKSSISGKASKKRVPRR